jgi:hypothetical protein
MRAVEYVLSHWIIGWGIVLLHPKNTFSTSEAYNVLEKIMGESYWGSFALLLGLIHLVATFNRDINLRIGTLYMVTGFWMLVTLSFAMAEPLSINSMMSIGITILCKWMASQEKKKKIKRLRGLCHE